MDSGDSRGPISEKTPFTVTLFFHTGTNKDRASGLRRFGIDFVRENSGKEKTHKHKQIWGIVPGLGGRQKVVYVTFFSG